MKSFKSEADGQEYFFEFLLGTDEKNLFLSNNTDGIYGSVLFEFKLTVPNINSVLLQCIKYLSKLRLKGIPVPYYTIIVSLNPNKAYIFKNEDLRKHINQIYSGPSSKNNDYIKDDLNQFLNRVEYYKIEDIFSINARKQFNVFLEEESYFKVDIDENSVVGWADYFYRNNPKSSKIQLFLELKNPFKLKQYINPWKGREDDFKDVMDLLNDPENKKKLGAFYTPEAYVKLGYNLLQKAIKIVPKDNDYVIIDRCAGTGNLEEYFTDEELAHTILATYEFKEWIVLYNRFSEKVKEIIPPESNHKNGLMIGGDALAHKVFPLCENYVDKPNINVILLENPPYNDTTSNKNNIASKKEEDSIVKQDMQNKIDNKRFANDLANIFIWSGFEYYLKKPEDSYIIYSPIKYWKTQHIVHNKTFKEGYILNKHYFHAISKDATTLIWWQNKLDIEKQFLNFKIRDIKDNKACVTDFIKDNVDDPDNYYIYRVNHQLSEILLNLPAKDKPIVFVGASAFNFNFSGTQLYNSRLDMKGHGGGKETSIKTALNNLVAFATRMYQDNEIIKFWERNILVPCIEDPDFNYKNDLDFKIACLVYSSLSPRNNCISKYKDGKYINTEIAFSEFKQDGNNIIFNKATASGILLKNNWGLININLKEAILDLLAQWNKILESIKKIPNFNENYNYNIYQISNELNPLGIRDNENKFHFKDEGNYDELKKIYRNETYYDEILHSDIEDLKLRLKKFYKDHIKEKLFQYKLIR